MNRREFIFGSVALGLTGPLSCTSNYECDEMARCKEDILYFANKYLNLDVESDYVIKFLVSVAKGKDVGMQAYRQSGKSTLQRAYAVWKAVFEPNQRISFVSYSHIASDLNDKIITEMIDRLPKWMVRTYSRSGGMRKSMQLENGSTINLIYGSTAAFCGYNPGNVLILDEFAFFRNQKETVQYLLPPLACNRGQLVMASTPNGRDDVFSMITNKMRQMEMYFNSSSVAFVQASLNTKCTYDLDCDIILS